MLSNIKILLGSSFIRNVMVVATGTAAAQAISMVFYPFITRLYGPEAFGLLGGYLAIVSILTPMVALTYPLAIVLPRKESEAIHLVQLSLLFSILISFLTLIFILTWGSNFTAYLNLNEIEGYLWLIPLFMFFSSLRQIAEQWLIRNKEFKKIAKISIIQSFITNTSQLGVGLSYPNGLALILVQTVFQCIWSIQLWSKISKHALHDIILIKKNFNSVKKASLKYKDFALFRAPEVTIYAASESAPVLMLSSFFGPASAGFYTLARTIMSIPTALIGKSVGDVFYPRINQAAINGESTYLLVRKATLLMAAVGFLPFMIVIIFGPWLFEVFFGADWKVAGDYARWLSIWLFFSFCNSPSIKAVPVIHAQGFQLIWTSLSIILRLTALYLAYYLFESEVSAIIFFAITGALLNALLILIVLNKCKTFDSLIK